MNTKLVVANHLLDAEVLFDQMIKDVGLEVALKIIESAKTTSAQKLRN